jgi:ubiquinone/menaquinone biosynthesis C-methylase UbiE
MAMFLKRQDPFGLLVGMTGVKLGDRLLQVGCAHAGRLGAIAGKVGLSGRAVAVVPDAESANRATKGAANAGVLVEVEIGPPTRLTFDADSFDLAVVDETAGLIGRLSGEDQLTAIRELLRILRPGGRALLIGTGPPRGLNKLFGGGQSSPSFVLSGDANGALESQGFRQVRTLAERDGLVFVEGLKPREGR